MNIALVIPPAKSPDKIPERVYGCTFTYYKQPELPLLYIAAVLEHEGHTVAFKDFTEHNSWGDFCRFVNRANYDVYIFHTVLLAESIDRRAAQYILDNGDAKIIFFGPHPTLKPQNFLLDEQCYVARGEAEFVVKDLIRGIEHNALSEIEGISFLKDGNMVENESYGIVEDLDILPFPSRHLIDDTKNEYSSLKLSDRPVTLVLTSRGCSFRCSYCVPNAISWARELEWRRFHNGKKPPVRFRSPQNIINEFRMIKAQGYRAVSVVDDLFLFGGKRRILDICDGLKDVGLAFGILSRCDMIYDEEMVKALKDAGCQYVDLGIESMEQRVLDNIQKDMDVSSVSRAINLLNKYGIEPKANIMFGVSPLETRENMKKAIREISQLPIHYCMFSIATPFPGTDFATRVREQGWAIEPQIHHLEDNLSPTEKSLVSYPHLSKKELEKGIKAANRHFYLNPKRIWYYVKKINSFSTLMDLIFTGWRIIK